MESSTVDPFRDNIFKMREKGWLVDVTIACSGQLFNAHKLILSASSEYFKEMFAVLPQQQYPIVFLKGVSQDLLKLALEFMYCGLVDIPEEKVQSFITLATEFRIKGLNINKHDESKSRNCFDAPKLSEVTIKTEIIEDDNESMVPPPAKRMKSTNYKRSLSFQSEKQFNDSDNIIEKGAENVTSDNQKIALESWELFAINFIKHIGNYSMLTINQVRSIVAASAEISGYGNAYNFHTESKWWHELKRKFPSIIDYMDKESLCESLNKLPTTKLFLEPFIEILNKFKLNKSPEFIWSCEEIAISAKKGLKRETIAYPARIRDHSSSNVSKNGSNMSILCSISPSGKSTSPFFVVGDDLSHDDELNKGNIIYASNSSGTVDKNILLQWFTDIFIPQCPRKRSKSKPVILLVDSQFFNITEELLDLALKENIMLLPLVPHIPVACQPFDLVLFNNIRPEIEAEFSEIKDKKQLRHSAPSNEPINTVKSVMDRHLTMDMIKDGFIKCGIFPTNLSSYIKCNEDRVGSTIRNDS